ncbi:hypothetical protein OG756_08850 [Streptomyces sp. NBC_01310]|uniref:hypothetical protein n=1 Tax=Streptomyces sp. NBC_01310 TaxID=2903820 RepID=UPI0035B60043|nr:hypothetical protein OG756_08850 [Streptomyces sp. NBC_01310]
MDGAARSGDAARGRALAQELVDGRAAGGPPPGSGPEVWLAFDQHVRHTVGYGPPPLAAPVELRLCHARGWTRQPALDDPQAPPELVAIRTADTVAPVRDRARAALERALSAHPEDTLLALTPLALRLGRREHGGWILDRFEGALRGRAAAHAPWWHPRRPPAAPAGAADVLSALLAGPDPQTRRFATRLALTGPGPVDALECARRAAAELDPVTAGLWADAALAALVAPPAPAAPAAPGADGPGGGQACAVTDAVTDTVTDTVSDAVTDALTESPLPAVRAAGVTALRRAGRAAEGARHLADGSGLVRACARWLVAQDGGDPREQYRWLIADPAGPSPYAVTGLAECGSREDTALLRELLAHPVGRVRAAALAGLRRRDAAVEDSVLLALLDDPAASVAREAALSLLPAAARLDPAHLAERAALRGPLHTRRAAFRLLRAQGGIHALRASVALIDDWDPKTRTTARATVRGWDWLLTRFTRQADTAELAALLKRSAKLFDDHELALWRARLGLTH